MVKAMTKILSVIFLLGFVTGCASSGGIRARSYVDVRERVDQELQEGNQGYLMGSAPAADESSRRKTRKVYVLEFTKELPKEQISAATPAPETSSYEATSYDSYESEEPQTRAVPALPDFDEQEVGGSSASAGVTEYTVDKNDTLQKISKKFYGTVKKWPQIFEANKDVLSDPNRLKPGMVLRIPQE